MSSRWINDIAFLFKDKKILVVGDAMIDCYVSGIIERQSPEAPVPILCQKQLNKRPGGAANVALNLKALGAEPILASVVGDDQNGLILRELLGTQGISDSAILTDNTRPTTEKMRLQDAHRQILRVDHESTDELNEVITTCLKQQIDQVLPTADAVLFQDYDKGLISVGLIRHIMNSCQERHIPVAVDPKERHYFDYGGATLFKPNLREFEKAHSLVLDFEDETQLINELGKMRDGMRCQYLLLTLSGRGLMLSHEDSFIHVPAESIEVKDVSGAGDTVIAVATLSLAAGLMPRQVAELSNLAGAIACENHGVTTVTPNQLLEKSGRLSPLSQG